MQISSYVRVASSKKDTGQDRILRSSEVCTFRDDVILKTRRNYPPAIYFSRNEMCPFLVDFACPEPAQITPSLTSFIRRFRDLEVMR